jgi:DNA-binding NtrC family response regulator
MASLCSCWLLPTRETTEIWSRFQARPSRHTKQPIPNRPSGASALIEEFLAASHGNISQAAAAARKNRRAFWQLIRKHKIDTQRFEQERETVSGGTGLSKQDR